MDIALLGTLAIGARMYWHFVNRKRDAAEALRQKNPHMSEADIDLSARRTRAEFYGFPELLGKAEGPVVEPSRSVGIGEAFILMLAGIAGIFATLMVGLAILALPFVMLWMMAGR